MTGWFGLSFRLFNSQTADERGGVRGLERSSVFPVAEETSVPPLLTSQSSLNSSLYQYKAALLEINGLGIEAQSFKLAALPAFQ